MGQPLKKLLLKKNSKYFFEKFDFERNSLLKTQFDFFSFTKKSIKKKKKKKNLFRNLYKKSH